MSDRHITRKVVVNHCYGGFGVSAEALALYSTLSGGVEYNDMCDRRDDPVLLRVIEQLGTDRSSGPCARLCVVDTCATHPPKLREYDGMEYMTPATRCPQCKHPNMQPARPTIRVRHFSV